MTFSDLLGRNMRWEWHEAVALVRDVVDRLEEPDAAIHAVPDLHQIELLPSGELSVRGGDIVADPVQRLAQMLQALLSRSDPPVQLRLSLAQPHESPRTWSDSLGFFERPDRRAVLRDLYSRASATLPLADADAAGPAPQTKPDQEERKERKAASSAASAKRRTVLLALGLPAVLIAAAGALYARRGESASPMGGTSAMLFRGVKEAVMAVGSPARVVGDRAQPGGPAADPGGAPTAATSAGAGTDVSTRHTRARRPAAATLIAPLPAAMNRAGLNTVGPLVAAPVRPGEFSAPLNVGIGTVYSLGSPWVLPPVGVKPQLPADLPPDMRPEDLTSIQLLILPDGTVESVKLLGRPRTIHDTMMLSAVKAWRFHPATKDGVPVSYRHTIRIAR